MTVSIATSSAVNHLECDAYIAIKELEYKILTNKSLLYTTSNTLLQPSDYVLSNGTIIHSMQPKQSKLHEQHDDLFRRLVLRQTHALPLAVASAFLVFSGASPFVTYILFEEIRTLHQKYTMNYGLAIATSQLLFIVAPVMTPNQNVCTAIGVCLHYSLLCPFTWSSVDLGDLPGQDVRLSSLLRDTQSKQSQSSTYTLYCLYG